MQSERYLLFKSLGKPQIFPWNIEEIPLTRDITVIYYRDRDELRLICSVQINDVLVKMSWGEFEPYSIYSDDFSFEIENEKEGIYLLKSSGEDVNTCLENGVITTVCSGFPELASHEVILDETLNDKFNEFSMIVARTFEKVNF